VAGFADPTHYDTMPSGISTPGGVASVFGQGGLLDAVSGSVSDLQALASGQGSLTNILGAAQKAGTTYNTFKGKNFNQILQGDLKTQGTNIALFSLPNATAGAVNAANGMIFPRAATISPGTGVISGGP
jgi:hypothetical protein